MRYLPHYVAIPKEDSLYIYGTQQGKWKQRYIFKIPENTVAMDGNERRVFFLTDKEMIVQGYYNCSSYCDRDTLLLTAINGKIFPKHWIRHLNSSENDFAYFDFGSIHYRYKDGEGWASKHFSNPFEKT